MNVVLIHTEEVAPSLTPHLTLLLEHEHGLWGRVDRERMGSLHGAATLTWHAVTASRVSKPQALEKEIVFYEMPLTQG